MGRHLPPDQEDPKPLDREHEEGDESKERDQNPASASPSSVGVHEKVVRIYGGGGSASHHDERSGEGEQSVRRHSAISVAGTSLLAALGLFAGVGIGYFLRSSEEPKVDPKINTRLRVLKGGKK